MRFTGQLTRLASSFLLLALSGIWLSYPACADDRPDEFSLQNAGTFKGEAALYVVQGPPYSAQSYNAANRVLALRAADGALLETLFTNDMAKQLFPDAKEWNVVGADSLGRCYIMLDWDQIALIANGEFIGELPGAEDFHAMDSAAFDGGLVGGSRFELQRIEYSPDVPSMTTSDGIDFFELPVKYLGAVDPPGCWHAVNRSGSLIYIGSEWEARVWDGRGNLRFDLGTVYPNPYGLRKYNPELDPELLYNVPRLYFSAPQGAFDTAGRLWLMYRGEMWAVDEDGREQTFSFELPDDQGEPLERAEFCFGDDPAILYALYDDRRVFIYDIAPTLELEESELCGLYEPKGLPPVLLASYTLEPEAE